MTFSEKLVRLRRREGLSQEALAEALGVSRQAISRWEQGTALPDGAKLLPCARYFGVRVDWLLDEQQEWEDQAEKTAPPPVQRTAGRGWMIAGAVVLAVSLVGLLAMGICSSVFPAVVTEAPAGVEWVHVYTGLAAFLMVHHLDWLFALCLLTAAAGVWMLLRPQLQKAVEKNPVLQSNLTLLPIAAQAGLVYSAAQSLWWIRQGREDYRGALWFSLVPLALASIWMVRNLMQEKDPARRRKNSLIELGYCVGQLCIGLLTADGGIGLVGAALNLILCLFYVQWVNPRYMGRCFSKR
ncbi:helix-turn-helix domain-containing protein [Dysosmobacter sp.]|uniref:helix-turn-helix domain-containing protein n=1 Tax=Dysosmobacter sp. TaxID=2591382 RepID=UPI003FD7D8EB